MARLHSPPINIGGLTLPQCANWAENRHTGQRLVEELRVAHGDGSDTKFLKTIAKAGVHLILLQ